MSDEWILNDVLVDDFCFYPYVIVSLADELISLIKNKVDTIEYSYKKKLNYNDEMNKNLNLSHELIKKQFILDVPRMEFYINNIHFTNTLSLLNYIENSNYYFEILLFCNQSIMASCMEIFLSKYTGIILMESGIKMKIKINNNIITSIKQLKICNGFTHEYIGNIIFKIVINLEKKIYEIYWK